MKALVFVGVGNIELKDVEDPVIQNPQDAIIKITTSAICGTDLHMIRGTMTGMQKNTILGHEGVGIIEAIGSDVHKFNIGDRVIIPSTIGCGTCNFCTDGIFSQCNNANPNGPESGTAFFGGPKTSGPIQGMQAEKVRVPFADANLVKIPDSLTDEQVILISDILPTAYMAVENAQVTTNDSVAVFGCGPVGQLVIACLKIFGVKEIFAIDNIPTRLKMAREQGAKIINFDEEDPVNKLKELLYYGPTKIIDAVGIDAKKPRTKMSNMLKNWKLKKQFKQELEEVAPITNQHNGHWTPGDAPSQVLQWAAQAIAKNGIISIIGVYPETLRFFPIGQLFEKNVTINQGNCNHRTYIPRLLDWVKEGKIDLTQFITQRLPLDEIVHAYHKFDQRADNWIKVIVYTEK